MAKKTTVNGSNEKLVAMAEDRDLFGRLLIIANVRQINLREILCFELSPVPYSLVHTDDTLWKTTKSMFLQILEGYVTVEARLPFLSLVSSVHVLDVMALVQMLKFAGASTFREIAAIVLTVFYQMWAVID